MQTLLLVAGRSRRFWPLAEKSLVPLLGKTLLEHQIGRLREGGCRDITLVMGDHNGHNMKKLFPGLPQIRQKDLTFGMQGALLSALPKVKGPVLIASGNDVIEPSAYRALREAAAEKGVDGAILARKVKRYFPGGYLTVKGGRATGIVEKPGEGNEPGKLVNIVAHVHNDSKALLMELKKSDHSKDDGYERALAELFKTRRYVVVPYEGAWQAVKYPWHLLPLLEMLLGTITEPKISKSAKIHPSATIEGNVIIDEGAKIFANASVIGPCYIGKNAIVGNGALVRWSSIGENCIVGFATEVKGSLLTKDVWTHMTYLGDSIIGENVSFGGGTVVGNLRLDEEEITSKLGDILIPTGLTKLGLMVGNDCRIGIRVGTNPGVKIGSGSFVAGGTYMKEDVPEKSFVCMKGGEAHVRENKMTVPGIDERKAFRAKAERKS